MVIIEVTEYTKAEIEFTWDKYIQYSIEPYLLAFNRLWLYSVYIEDRTNGLHYDFLIVHECLIMS